jgi:hypothetical protein
MRWSRAKILLAGGAPQLVGLYRHSAGMHFGTYFEERATFVALRTTGGPHNLSHGQRATPKCRGEI